METVTTQILEDVYQAGALQLTRLAHGTKDVFRVQRASAPDGNVVVTPTNDYVFIDWGPDFQQDHAIAFPELTNPGLNLDVGPISLDYILANECAGYFPLRMVRTHVARGRLRIPKRARKFVYPVYMVYPEARDEEAYEPIINGLRREAARNA